MTDYDIAHKYISKADLAKQNGIEFELSFQSFKNMMNAKRCQYTGLLFDDQGSRDSAFKRTVDRIDSRKGYVKGNVVVICNAANNFKSLFENPQYSITPKMARNIIGIFEKNNLQ